MEQHAIGTINQIDRVPTKTGKVFYALKMTLRDGTPFEGTSWSADFAKPEMKGSTIEFSYTTNGKYNNLSPRWSFITQAPAPQAQAQPQAAPVSQPAAYAPTNRDEQIVRQSSMNYAVTLVNAMSQAGSLPFAKTGKGAQAAKDPQVWLELTFELAKRIKDRVMEGDWSKINDSVVESDSQAPSEDDIPF